jgi:hypothetical protein
MVKVLGHLDGIRGSWQEIALQEVRMAVEDQGCARGLVAVRPSL